MYPQCGHGTFRFTINGSAALYVTSNKPKNGTQTTNDCAYVDS